MSAFKRTRYGRGTQRSKRDGSMTKLEARYAQHLEVLKKVGDIAEFAFEPESLRLAKGRFYKPDFRVMRPDGAIEFHEVKGVWGIEQASELRLKMASELHPYRFFKVRWDNAKDGWIVSEV